MNFKDFKKKSKEIVFNAKDWLTANKKIAAPMGVVVLIAVIIIIVVVGSPKGEEASTAGTPSTASSEGMTNVIPVPEAPLEENAYPAVNSLMSEYFAALEQGDLDTIRNLKSYMDSAEEIRIQKKSELIESYENISCYTKMGPLEDSYLVYVYVDARFKEIDTLAPGLYSYFVCKKEDGGGYWIMDGEMDNNITEYFKAISSQEDVEDLFNKVKVKYNDALASDEELKTFVEALPSEIKASVGEALAALEAESSQPAEEGSTEEIVTEEATEPAEQETEPASEETAPEYVKATDVVNVRSSDSETADKVGKVQIGTVMKLYENRANGWSKIDFEGKEAYIKTEFLEVTETPAEGGETEETGGQAAEEPIASGTAIQVKTTVNVRATTSETGDKLGVAYEGESLEVIMKQADGWTKVKYKGKTGYVKSEFLD